MTLNAVEATVAEVTPVFEKDSASFSVTVKGPSQPSKVELVHGGECERFL